MYKHLWIKCRITGLGLEQRAKLEVHKGREITSTCRKLFPEYDFQTKQTHKNLDLQI